MKLCSHGRGAARGGAVWQWSDYNDWSVSPRGAMFLRTPFVPIPNSHPDSEVNE